MSDIEPIPQIQELYREPERMSERTGLVRLDRNERLSPFPASAFAEMKELVTPDLISTYPDPAPLYSRMSRVTGLREECFFFTNGSDAALRLILQAFIRPGDKLVCSNPSYAMLSVYAKITQANVQSVPYTAGIHLDVDRIIALLNEQPRMLVLPNPDQPTGTVIAPAQLKNIIEIARSNGTIVTIDEAYYPFYPESVLNWVNEYENLLLTRSFSKAWGLSGLRLGLMAGSPRLVEYASRLRGLHEVNAMAAAIGCYMLDHPEIVEEYVLEVETGRKALESGAKKLRIGFPPCYTNFQLLKLDEGVNTKNIVEKIKSHGFLIKGGFSAPALTDYIRTTVGPVDLMNRFLVALTEVLNP